MKEEEKGYIRFEMPIQGGMKVIIVIPNNISCAELNALKAYLDAIENILFS